MSPPPRASLARRGQPLTITSLPSVVSGVARYVIVPSSALSLPERVSRRVSCRPVASDDEAEAG
jgi:hypothetical protein